MQEHSRFVKMKKRIFTLGKRLDAAEALAASRLVLLRRVVEESFFDVEKQQWYWQCNQEEFDEMVEELGDGD